MRQVVRGRSLQHHGCRGDEVDVVGNLDEPEAGTAATPRRSPDHGVGDAVTRCTSVTSGPTLSTVPDASLPRPIGASAL